MSRMSFYLALASYFQYLSFAHGNRGTAITVPRSPPANASLPIPEAFISYSIEFAFFPDFSGNSTHPNTYSNNLLNNLGNLTGTKPYIRVGGNTQDYALYNASQPYAVNGTYNNARSLDYPTTIHIGPSFFDSYNTFPDTKYVHGFNLGLGGNNSIGFQTLLDTVPLACKVLRNGKLLWWEYGNEPDLYSTSAQGAVRPPGWHDSSYVSQWLNGTRAIKRQLAKYCPEFLEGGKYGYLAPSFAGTNNRLKPLLTWQDGLNVDGDVKMFSSHNYIGGATQPGVTLQGTLLNHSKTISSISSQTNLSSHLAPLSSGIPFILGETNSLYNQGKPGLSNSFGAALWGIDFNLWCASVGIRRVHMHMGTDYRYAAWQPIQTLKTSRGTKPPYYGQIVAAAFLGDLTENDVRVINIPLPDEKEAAYARYRDEKLTRIAVVSMRAYNYTVNGTSSSLNPVKRPSQKYSFQVPEYCEGDVKVKRLVANGSDAITGITWDGWSYNWELDEGRPVRLGNVTVGERVRVIGGVVRVEVQDSGAVILELGKGN